MQIINYGKQKLLLLGNTAHKINSEMAQKWAEEWFFENWQSVKLIGGTVHLPSLAIVNKCAADFYANANYSERRTILAAIADGQIMAALNTKH